MRESCRRRSWISQHARAHLAHLRWRGANKIIGLSVHPSAPLADFYGTVPTMISATACTWPWWLTYLVWSQRQCDKGSAGILNDNENVTILFHQAACVGVQRLIKIHSPSLWFATRNPFAYHKMWIKFTVSPRNNKAYLILMQMSRRLIAQFIVRSEREIFRQTSKEGRANEMWHAGIMWKNLVGSIKYARNNTQSAFSAFVQHSTHAWIQWESLCAQWYLQGTWQLVGLTRVFLQSTILIAFLGNEKIQTNSDVACFGITHFCKTTFISWKNTLINPHNLLVAQ